VVMAGAESMEWYQTIPFVLFQPLLWAVLLVASTGLSFFSDSPIDECSSNLLEHTCFISAASHYALTPRNARPHLLFLIDLSICEVQVLFCAHSLKYCGRQLQWPIFLDKNTQNKDCHINYHPTYHWLDQLSALVHFPSLIWKEVIGIGNMVESPWICPNNISFLQKCALIHYFPSI
jgi:hypothetical protein